MTLNPIRILIVDDHALIRHGLRLMCANAGFAVVAEAENGQQALRLARQHQPEVVLLDVQMPVLDGLATARQLLAEHPQLAILMLTLFDEQAQTALQIGARGYLLKNTLTEAALAQSIHTVLAGGVFLDATVAAQLATPPAAQQPQDLPLTEIELAILQQVANGAENKQIALALNLTEKTISNRLNLIYQKIGVSNRVQAARYALQHGISTLKKP